MTAVNKFALGICLVLLSGELIAAGARLRTPGPAKKIPREIDEPALLRAIAAVESRNNPHAIGPFGERSKYQFTRETWERLGHEPFEWATTRPELAAARALRHLAYLRSVLRLRGIPETARYLAAGWHYGQNFAKICSDTDYVRRVLNLYEVEAGEGRP